MSLGLKRRVLIAMASSSGSGTPDDPVVTPDSYDPSAPKTPNSSTIYQGSPGEPKVTTDENGKVTQYEFTNTGTTGVTTQNVDTGIIAFDQSNPGWTLHLVAEFTPSASTASNAIIIANNGSEAQGLTIYSQSRTCHYKIKTQASDTTGSKNDTWSTFSPTGNNNNYYRNRNEITFDIVYTADKKFTLRINNKSTKLTDFSYDMTLDGITIMVGQNIPNFTIKEFTVTK